MKHLLLTWQSNLSTKILILLKQKPAKYKTLPREFLPSFKNLNHTRQIVRIQSLSCKMKCPTWKGKFKSTKESSKIITGKINSKNRSKSIKRNISLNGKKEFKLHKKSIPRLWLKLIFKTESQRLIKSSNGSLLLFMDSHKQSFIGPILNNKFSSEMKGKILEWEWEK